MGKTRFTKPSNLKLVLNEYKKAYHCHVPWWRLSSSWRKVRKQALIRDNYTCQVSGVRNLKGMHVHHKNGAKDYPMQRLTLDNLETLHPWYHKDKWYSIHAWLGGTRVKCTAADFERWKVWLRKQFKPGDH